VSGIAQVLEKVATDKISFALFFIACIYKAEKLISGIIIIIVSIITKK